MKSGLRRLIPLAFALISFTAGSAATEGASEYEVKAAFLFNFSKFVEWPGAAFAGASDPITICILGENPFGNLLKDAVRDKKVNGRQMAVQQAQSVSATAGCQIVFIASSEEGRLDEILSGLASHPVLTVSDTALVADRGAIIGLTLNEKRVRFEVNMAAARRAGLRLGSQLLKVAVRLIGQSDQGR
jgi:hypothetical protein